MKKGTTVYEDKAAKEAKRRKQEEEYRIKHTASCPHCGKDVLDHMTKCPNCGKELKPVGYTPLSGKKLAVIKAVTFTLGMIVAILIILFAFK